MEGHETQFQTVFLIDLDTLKDYVNAHSVESHKLITLSAFRILFYFRSQSRHYNCDVSGKKKDHLKWGFKLFDSTAYKVGRNQPNLREFKLRFFEEFEKEVETFISKQTKHASPLKKSKTKGLCPAENLSRALKEILYDFQWESPEFVSPMKGRRNQPPTSQLSCNTVFIFSKLPRNSADLRIFCGKKVIDDEVFMDSFMSASLFEMFHVSAKLSLFWIDTNLKHDISLLLEEDTKQIISKSLKKTGGCTFPLSYLLKLPLSFYRAYFINKTNNPSPNKTNQPSLDIKEPNIFHDFVEAFPVESILNHRLQTSDQCSSGIEVCINIIDGETCFAVPILLTQTNSVDQNKGNATNKKSFSEANSISFTLCTDIHNISGKQSNNRISVNVIKNKHTVEDEDPTQFLAVGCIQHTDSDFHAIQVSKTYLCHNLAEADTSEHILPNILEDLIKDNKKMVVISTGIIPYLGILESINKSGGILTLYHIGSSLQIEKAMLKQDYEMIDGCDVNNHLTDISRPEVLLTRMKVRALGQQFNQKCFERQKILKDVSKRRAYNSQILNKWHLPGTSQRMESIIMKLNERLRDLEFLNPSEKQTLKNLQKFYRKQNQPPKLQKSKPIGEFQNMDENAMSSDDVNMTSLTVESGYPFKRQSSSTLSRTDIIISRSKHVQKRQSSELPSCSQKIKNDVKPSFDFSDIDLQTDNDVSSFIKDLYEKCIQNGDNLETCIHNIVTVVLHYSKTNNTPQPEEASKTLINNSIKLTISTLREKYTGKTSDLDKKEKTTEYQLQILLLLELESVTMSDDNNHIEQCADEIVNMLRTISFISDQSVVPKFLNDVLVTSYSATLPKLLVIVFDELMQPLPDELAGFVSPDTSGDASLDQSVNSHNDSTVFQEPNSNTSNHSDILLTQPSRRSRRIVQHPSLSDFGSKKQIMVPIDSKAKITKEKKEKVCGSNTSSKLIKHKQNEAVKVRRNLFEGDKPKLDRRQSVAVMENVRRSPRKHHVLSASFKSPTAGSKSPMKRIVAETPSHKQKSNPVWRQQEKKRRRTNSKNGIKIVEESPMKAAGGETEPEVKASPGRFRKKATVTRRSFYSASTTRTRPRNLSAYYNLGDRIAGRHRTFSQSDDKLNKSLSQLAKSSPSKKFMSPTRRSRSFLMSQLMSPSPNKNSPQKIIESPFQGTRSKTPIKSTQTRLLFESPKNRTHSPSKLLGRTSETKTPKKQVFQPSIGLTTPKSKNLVFETIEKKTPGNLKEIKENLNSIIQELYETPKKGKDFMLNQGSRSTSTQPHFTPDKTVTPKQIGKSSHINNATPSKILETTKSINNTIVSSILKPDNNYQTLNKTPQSKSAQKSLSEDSPFCNTRSQGSVTPTRDTVGRALFTTSPPKTYVSPQSRPLIEDSLLFKTPSKSIKLKSPTSAHKSKFFSPLKDILLPISHNKAPSGSKSEDISPEKPTYILRTPSPHDKNMKSKTPDSFDKWPRRKRRSSSCQKQEYNKSTVVMSNVSGNKESFKSEISVSIPYAKGNVNIDNVHKPEQQNDNTEEIRHNSDMNVIYSKKRELITYADETFMSSSSKRRRTDSYLNKTNEIDDKAHSQNSSQSSKGYFSNMNNEVFLPNKNLNLKLDSNQGNGEYISQASDSMENCKSPVFGTSPLRKKKTKCQQHLFGLKDVHFTNSEESINSNSDISLPFKTIPGSPIFKNKILQTMSPLSTKSKAPLISESPKDKKFSPSISSNSLVQLMNSPLIQSKNKEQLDSMKSPRNPTNSKSRKSLKLND